VRGAEIAGDPWEGFNRRIFAFNQRFDRAVLLPLSRLIGGLTPGPIGRAVHNFVVNLKEPVVIVNDLLQARPLPAVKSAVRLVVNTTAGGLGAIDVAKAMGIPAHNNGFGDTLGRWGATPGPYLVVPVLGPATIRDLFGSTVDVATEPAQFISYPYRTWVDIGLSLIGGLNERQEVGKALDALLSGAADPYATLRSSYLQSRESEIRGEKTLPPMPEFEDETLPAETTPPAPGVPPAAVTPPAPPSAAPSPKPSDAGPSVPSPGEADSDGGGEAAADDGSSTETRL
jgi:phospholipid-binding lipoprotein MlaA